MRNAMAVGESATRALSRRISRPLQLKGNRQAPPGTGALPVYFGDSSKSEMCFAGLYRYPALTGTGCQ